MNLIPGYVALSAFLATVGLLVFAARPEKGLNRTLGALLVLRAGFELMFEVQRQAPDPLLGYPYARIAYWYYFPVLFLNLLLLHLLFPSAPFRRVRVAALAAVGVVVAGLLAALALLPGDAARVLVPMPTPSSVEGVLQSFTAHTPVETAWALGLRASVWLLILVCGREAVSTARSALQRRQAALVGVSFVFLNGYDSGHKLVHPFLAQPGPTAYDWIFLASAMLALAIILRSVPRHAAAFAGPARAAVLLAGLSPVYVGAFDASVDLLRDAGAPIPWWYTNSDYLWTIAFSLGLSVALVRFGLAGFARPLERRVARTSHAALVLAAVALPAAVVLWATGGSAGGILAAAVVGAGALALSPVPLRGVARAVTRVLVVSPLDPDAVGERARVYSLEIERRGRDSGSAPGANDPYLRRLREDLGLDERDHAILAQLAQEARAVPAAAPLLGRYRIERELGRGASGTALLAVDLGTGDRVVLKRFHHPAAGPRVLREARALSSVRHPRVVPLLAVEKVGPETFLVLRHAEGGTAQGLLDRSGPLPPDRAVGLASDLLEGLEAVHAAGFAHGDVKPENLLLDGAGAGLLSDLGSARLLGRAALDVTVTVQGAGGSYATLAPEILRGGPPTVRSDLYSAGATLFRLLTGEHYVELDPRSEVRSQASILEGKPRIPHARVPRRLEPVLLRALEKEPELRFASAQGMLDALRRAAPASRAAAEADRDPPAPAGGRPEERRPSGGAGSART